MEEYSVFHQVLPYIAAYTYTKKKVMRYHQVACVNKVANNNKSINLEMKTTYKIMKQNRQTKKMPYDKVCVVMMWIYVLPDASIIYCRIYWKTKKLKITIKQRLTYTKMTNQQQNVVTQLTNHTIQSKSSYASTSGFLGCKISAVWLLFVLRK